MSQTTLICARTGHQLFDPSFYTNCPKIDAKSCTLVNCDAPGLLVYVLTQNLRQQDQKHESNSRDKLENRCLDFDTWVIQNLDSLLKKLD
jgi:hypothetical protein